MATLGVGEIRKFRGAFGEMDGVVVYVDRKWSCYQVLFINGEDAPVHFGDIVGPSNLSADYKKALKVVCEEFVAHREAVDLRMQYEQEANNRYVHLTNLRNSLRANYRG